MARSRNIKPGLFQNEYLAELGPVAMLVFAGLPTLADRDGWLEDRPKRLKMQLLPYTDCDMDEILESLADSPEKFIERKTANGKSYIRICNFHLHQSPHGTERESVIAPLFNGEVTVVAHPPTIEGISNKESVTGNQESVPPKQKRAEFKPPTVDEVRAYCLDRANSVDADTFVDFYTSKNWLVGKTRMSDWKASVRTWEKNSRGSPQNRNDPRGNLALRDKLLAELELE